MTVVIAAGRPDRRRRDLDNIATKAELDLLTAHGVIEDDAYVLRSRHPGTMPPPPSTVRVTVEPAMVTAYAKA